MLAHKAVYLFSDAFSPSSSTRTCPLSFLYFKIRLMYFKILHIDFISILILEIALSFYLGFILLKSCLSAKGCESFILFSQRTMFQSPIIPKLYALIKFFTNSINSFVLLPGYTFSLAIMNGLTISSNLFNKTILCFTLNFFSRNWH